MNYFGVNYWVMLIAAPLLVGVFGVVLERLLLRWIYKLDHLYGLLLTLGLTMVIEGSSAPSTASRAWATTRPSCSKARPTWAS